MSLSNQVDPALKKDEERATSFVENVDSLTSATVSVQGPARNIDATSTSVTEGPIAVRKLFSQNKKQFTNFAKASR